MIRLEKIFKGEIKMKSNKGITLIALAVTIIVIIIIASVGTYSGVQALRDSKEDAQLSEVRMIQQAVLENYTKYKTTGNDMYLRGKKVEFQDAKNLIDEINEKSSEENIEMKIHGNPQNGYHQSQYVREIAYYELMDEDLKQMGISQVEGGTFVVNYITGEVINQKLKVTRTGKPLYVYSNSYCMADD